MAHGNIEIKEKVADLWKGMSIWKVHLDVLLERDVNARVMPLDKFERLTENIKSDKRLESLPLVTPIESKGGDERLLIISGHHRTRAARAAGIMEIFVMVIEDQLAMDEIISKQLAHNALSGEDDAQVLQQLYEQIENINLKMASGLTDLEVNYEMPSINSDDITVDFDFEPINIMFMKSDADKFDEMLEMLDSDAKAYIADKKDFDKLVANVKEVSKREDLRNIAGIFLKFMDIVTAHYDTERKADSDAERETIRLQQEANRKKNEQFNK